MLLTPEALEQRPPTPEMVPPSIPTEKADMVRSPGPPELTSPMRSPIPITVVNQSSVPAPAPSASMAGGETTFYSHPDGIRITTTRAIFQSKVYAMANVSSVSMGMSPAKRYPGILVAVVGLLLLATKTIVPGVIIMAIGVAWAAMKKNIYHVRLGSASGETSAWSSNNVHDVEQIVRAMNEAFVQRG
jgi:hypothetical protein